MESKKKEPACCSPVGKSNRSHRVLRVRARTWQKRHFDLYNIFPAINYLPTQPDLDTRFEATLATSKRRKRLGKAD